jgi:hypothetical protein
MIVADVLKWRWALLRGQDETPKWSSVVAWVTEHCPAGIVPPTDVVEFMNFGEGLIRAQALTPAMTARLCKVWDHCSGAVDYDPAIDAPICECGHCHDDPPPARCLYFGMPKAEKAFLQGFIVWCSSHPEHLQSPVWLAEIAFHRAESARTAQAARSQAREIEDREGNKCNAVLEKHGMPWRVPVSGKVN